MKQRKYQALRMLSAVTIILAAPAPFTGCVHQSKRPDFTHLTTQAPYRLQVVIHGPAATIVQNDAIKIIVPRDKDGSHQVRSPLPTSEDLHSVPKGCKVTTDFQLQGVRSAGAVAIDPAFEPIIFRRPAWKQEEQDTFVTMELPLPHSIDALGPLDPVRFASNNDAMVPLTEILEFDISDLKKTSLMRTDTLICGIKPPRQTTTTLYPVPCHEMQQHYDRYFQATPDPDAENSQRPYIMHAFQRCTNGTLAIFIGVGLPPTTYSNLEPGERHMRLENSGRDFFNDQLLRVVYGTDPIPPDKKLIPRSEPRYRPGRYFDRWSPPRFITAAYRVAAPEPASMVLLATENCTSPPVIIIAK